MTSQGPELTVHVGGARPSSRQLGREVAGVAVALPLFVAAPFVRRWHRRWGATDAEIAAERRRILEESQPPVVGDWIPMFSKVNDTTAFKVAAIDHAQSSSGSSRTAGAPSLAFGSLVSCQRRSACMDTAAYHRPTSGPRSTSPASPGGVGKDAKLSA